jgi:hypothetical protein
MTQHEQENDFGRGARSTRRRSCRRRRNRERRLGNDDPVDFDRDELDGGLERS